MIVLVDNTLNAYNDPILLYIHYSMLIAHKIIKFKILSIKHQTIQEYLTSLNVSGDYIHGIAGPKSFRYIVWKGKRFGPTFCSNTEKLNDLFNNKQEVNEFAEELRSYSTSSESSLESVEFNKDIIPIIFTGDVDKIRFLEIWKILNIAKFHYKLPHELVNDPIRRLTRILKSGINHFPNFSNDQYNEYYQNLDWVFDYFIMNENQKKIIYDLIKVYRTKRISTPIVQIIQLIKEFQLEIMSIKSSKFLKESTPISEFARYCVLTRHSIFTKFGGSRKDLILFWNEIWKEWSTLSDDERSKKMISSNGIHRSWADDDEFRLFIESSDESNEDVDWFNNDSTIFEFNNSVNGLELIKESECEDLEDYIALQPESKDSVLSNFTNSDTLGSWESLDTSGRDFGKIGYGEIVGINGYLEYSNKYDKKNVGNIVYSENLTKTDNKVVDFDSKGLAGDIADSDPGGNSLQKITEDKTLPHNVGTVQCLNDIKVIETEVVNKNDYIQHKKVSDNIEYDIPISKKGLQIENGSENDHSASENIKNNNEVDTCFLISQDKTLPNNNNKNNSNNVQENVNEFQHIDQLIDEYKPEEIFNGEQTIQVLGKKIFNSNESQEENETLPTHSKQKENEEKEEEEEEEEEEDEEEEEEEDEDGKEKEPEIKKVFNDDLDINSTFCNNDVFSNIDTINVQNIELFLPDEHLIGHVPGKLMIGDPDYEKLQDEKFIDHGKELHTLQKANSDENKEISINDFKKMNKDIIIDESNDSFDSLIFKQPGALTALLDSPSSSYTSSPTQSDLELDLDFEDLNITAFKLKKYKTETIPAKIDMFEKLSGHLPIPKHQRHLNQFNKISETKSMNDVNIKRKLKPVVKRKDSVTIMELKELIENKPELSTLKTVKHFDNEKENFNNPTNFNNKNNSKVNDNNNSNMIKKGRSISEIFAALLDDNMKDLSLSAEYKNKVVKPEDLYNRVKIKSDKSWDKLSRKTKERYYGAFLRKYNNLIEGDNFKNLDLNDILEILKVCVDFGDIKHKIVQYAVNLIDLEGDDSSSINSSIMLSRGSSIQSIREDE